MEVMPKRHLEASTEQARAAARKQLGPLKQLTVQPVTRARYESSRTEFYQWLASENLALPSTPYQLDLLISDYLEALWASGKGRTVGSTILAALQDQQPHLKGRLKLSWRLMKTWVSNEIPNRAPPLSADVLHLLVGYSMFKEWHLFATSLLVAFHGLLRTGELLGVLNRHVAISGPKGPATISLGLTKSGKRQGAAESVTFHAEDVCRRLYQWKQSSPAHASLTGSNYAWRKRFATVLTAVGLDGIDYRPYSLRRGGATHFFQLYGNFDKILVLGRWQSIATARLYINEGLAVQAELSIPWSPFTRNLRSQYLKSLTVSLPKLDPSTKKASSQGRGSRKQQKKSKSKGKNGSSPGV